jgi:hypothetical protein
MTPEEAILVADHATSMKAVLTELDYDIWKVPLQIACPVHKLGGETRLSARIYEDDRTVWCFYCIMQYRPTEVWAAQKGVDRAEAAGTILSRWPVSEDDSRAALRRARAPYKPEITDVYLGVLERHLVNYRGVADFTKYRKWAKACDEFTIFIGTIPEESQETAIFSFIERMNAALSERS